MTWRRGHGWQAVALGLTALNTVACDSGILEVVDPDVVTPGSIQGERGAELYWAGALGRFARAFSSGTGGQAVYSGLASDEFHSSDTSPYLHLIDSRQLDDRNSSLRLEYIRLHQARVGTLNAARQLESAFSRDSRIAEMWSLNGFTHLFFAEHYCSGVPLSHTPLEGEIVYGPRVPTADILDLAIERFETAGDAVDGDADQANLASVGLARAYLDQGLYDQAAAAVAAVPDGWEYLIRSTAGGATTQTNAFFYMNYLRRGWSLSDGEGGNGIEFRTASDGRVPWQDPGVPGVDGTTSLYVQLKYSSADDDVVLASGVEARLIEAEADLNGAASDWLGILNDLRAGQGLGDLADPGTFDGRVDLLFEERARWLFGTAHRLGDLRRLVRQYGRDESSVFPTGPYFRGGDYGSDVNFPIPIDELQNPELSNLTGAVCIDRDA